MGYREASSALLLPKARGSGRHRDGRRAPRPDLGHAPWPPRVFTPSHSLNLSLVLLEPTVTREQPWEEASEAAVPRHLRAMEPGCSLSHAPHSARGPGCSPQVNAGQQMHPVGGWTLTVSRAAHQAHCPLHNPALSTLRCMQQPGLALPRRQGEARLLQLGAVWSLSSPQLPNCPTDLTAGLWLPPSPPPTDTHGS